jgi:signal transduction histidine kinase
LEQPTVLIVSDDAEFSRALTGRWQAERTNPAFTLMSGDLCQQLDETAFALAVIGSVRQSKLGKAMAALEATNKPVLVIRGERQNSRALGDVPSRFMQLRKHEGWLDAAVLVAAETLRRIEAGDRLRRAEETNALLQQHATLGNYMREMLHSLNNALTSVLGNSELLLLEPGSLAADSRSQVETIRNMALRMHEILHRFASLEKEMKVVARQAEEECNAKARSAAAR